MANSELTTGSGGDTQTTAGNLQSTGQLQSAGQTQLPGTSNVQGSAVGSQINIAPAQGIVLTNNLGQTGSASVSQSTGILSAPIKPHHFNVALISLPLLLVVLAAGLFWFTARSAKNTTDYS